MSELGKAILIIVGIALIIIGIIWGIEGGALLAKGL